MNRLATERSPYLKHAARQKIDWYPWSEEAFDEARRRGKPVLLSSGAAWCHWCHVMAGESFEDEAIAELLNELFICIKLDRDERPDIDRRYQQAVAAMGGGSGWPLTVFLTPDKRPFFGGTYFPPRDVSGRPGFTKVLLAVSRHFNTKKEDAESYALSVMEALQPDQFAPSGLQEDMPDKAESSILSLFDAVNGGFGSAPKFPMPGALEFLLQRFSAGRNAETAEAARKTLLAMAAGGFHDQLGGGFHRYSVDEAWIIPHFEKMADDNAGLLRNYADGYALFGDELFRQTAEGIIRFTRTELADPRGGFHASLDADVTPADEGGYFTWSEAELGGVLTPAEYEVISRALVHPRGVMHHDPSRRVLAFYKSPEEVAAGTGREPGAVRDLLRSGRAKLLEQRKARQAPLADRTLYTSLNGMLIAAYFRAFMVMGDPQIRDFAALSLERIWDERRNERGLDHGPGVKGMLDDYIHLADAFIAAYEATAEQRFLDRAEEVMELCFEKFLDRDQGGLFDTEEEVLGTRMKRIEDLPHPSGNAVGIKVLLKLSLITGREEYSREAERALRIFAVPAEGLSIHAGSYFSALHAYFHRSLLTVEAPPESGIAREARAAAVRSWSAVLYGPDSGRVVPCLNGSCSAPLSEAGLVSLARS